MTSRERFLCVLHGHKPHGRLPMLEWGAFWDETLARWRQEGLPADMDVLGYMGHLGLDRMNTIRAGASLNAPAPKVYGGPVVETEEEYEALRPRLFGDALLRQVVEAARSKREQHRNGSLIQHLWLDGFFWFPRTLLGIEGHLCAFYDAPELMHRMNRDLAQFNLRVIEALGKEDKPDVVIMAEDISYNHGPMISQELFCTFITPYYQMLLPEIKRIGIRVLMDSDGDISRMLPLLVEAGIDGIGPLERQAGVDIAEIRAKYPDMILFGGYDKMVMSRGEEAMRTEFERILPVMKSGYYLPMVDHQTPPGVSLDQYREYISLYAQYAALAAE